MSASDASGDASGKAIGTAVTGAMLVADPEMTVPLLAVTHPKKSIGAILLTCAVVLAIISAVLYMTGISHTMAKWALIIAALLGASGAFLIFHEKHPKAAAHKQ